MVAAFVLVAGVLFVSILGFVACLVMKLDAQAVLSLIPFLPLVVSIGSALLVLAELLLVFGTSEDRRVCFRDLCWLVPLFIISTVLFYYIHVNNLY